jgi:hypothetical protein
VLFLLYLSFFSCFFRWNFLLFSFPARFGVPLGQHSMCSKHSWALINDTPVLYQRSGSSLVAPRRRWRAPSIAEVAPTGVLLGSSEKVHGYASPSIFALRSSCRCRRKPFHSNIVPYVNSVYGSCRFIPNEMIVLNPLSPFVRLR